MKIPEYVSFKKSVNLYLKGTKGLSEVQGQIKIEYVLWGLLWSHQDDFSFKIPVPIPL